MARSGSQAVYSSGPGLGITGRIISTDTSIIIWTIARATTAPCRRAAKVQRNTVKSFMARQCMMYMATRPLVDTICQIDNPKPAAAMRSYFHGMTAPRRGFGNTYQLGGFSPIGSHSDNLPSGISVGAPRLGFFQAGYERQTTGSPSTTCSLQRTAMRWRCANCTNCLLNVYIHARTIRISILSASCFTKHQRAPETRRLYEMVRTSGCLGQSLSSLGLFTLQAPISLFSPTRSLPAIFGWLQGRGSTTRAIRPPKPRSTSRTLTSCRRSGLSPRVPMFRPLQQ